MKNGKGNYRNNLRAANLENAALRARNQQLQAELVRCIGLLATTLEQFHGGKVDLNLGLAVKWLQVRQMPIAYREFKEFGIVRVETRKTSVEGTPEIALTEHNLAVPTSEQSEPEPPTLCPADWHSDPDARGVMCPECGGKGKRDGAEER